MSNRKPCGFYERVHGKTKDISAKFKEFGNHTIDWPRKSTIISNCPPRGHTYIMFDHESSVEQLIQKCHKENNKFYINVCSTKVKNKPAEVKPWLLSDEDYISDMSKTLDPRKTAFVANLPCAVKAGDLAVAVNAVHGGVCYAGIDVDSFYRYPKHTGRITFDCAESYRAVVNTRFVKVKHATRVEIKPCILNDQQCYVCSGCLCKSKYAPYFCSNSSCSEYYCEECWGPIHASSSKKCHKPILLGKSRFSSTTSILSSSESLNAQSLSSEDAISEFGQSAWKL